MTTEQVAIDRAALSKATRKGLWGAFWLAVMTIVEFIVADIGNGEPWALWALLPFVLAKGWIILDTFMHIRALWSEDH
ncbi:MAG TPA: cytochrome C oxidase subunit IV family protein [Acidimicrobiia bacterium]|nr:cytochrome C oxidase subunit IV family protein [Acidimicrobiia bacterium]